MNRDGYNLDQGNRPDDWWDRLQQDAYDEAGAVVGARQGGPIEESKLFAQLAAEVDFRAPQMEESHPHRAPSGPDLDF